MDCGSPNLVTGLGPLYRAMNRRVLPQKERAAALARIALEEGDRCDSAGCDRPGTVAREAVVLCDRHASPKQGT